MNNKINYDVAINKIKNNEWKKDILLFYKQLKESDAYSSTNLKNFSELGMGLRYGLKSGDIFKGNESHVTLTGDYNQAIHSHPFNPNRNNLRFSDDDLIELVNERVKTLYLVCGEELLEADISTIPSDKIEEFKQTAVDQLGTIYLRYGAKLNEKGNIDGESILELSDELYNEATNVINQILSKTIESYGGKLKHYNIQDNEILDTSNQIKYNISDEEQTRLALITAARMQKNADAIKYLQKEFGVLQDKSEELDASRLQAEEKRHQVATQHIEEEAKKQEQAEVKSNRRKKNLAAFLASDDSNSATTVERISSIEDMPKEARQAKKNIENVKKYISDLYNTIDKGDTEGIIKKYLFGSDGKIKSGKQLVSEITSEFKAVSDKFGEDYAKNGIVHSPEEYMSELEETFRKIRSSLFDGLINHEDIPELFRNMYNNWSKQDNEWIDKFESLGDDVAPLFGKLYRAEETLGILQKNDSKEYIEYLKTENELKEKIKESEEKAKKISKPDFDNYTLDEKQSKVKSQEIKNEINDIDSLIAKLKELNSEDNKLLNDSEVDDIAPIHLISMRIRELEELRNRLQDIADDYENAQSILKRKQINIFDKGLEGQLLTKANPPKELEDEYERLTDEIISGSIDAYKALQKFNDRAEELGFTFDEDKGKWIALSSSISEDTDIDEISSDAEKADNYIDELSEDLKGVGEQGQTSTDHIVDGLQEVQIASEKASESIESITEGIAETEVKAATEQVAKIVEQQVDQTVENAKDKISNFVKELENREYGKGKKLPKAQQEEYNKAKYNILDHINTWGSNEPVVFSSGFGGAAKDPEKYIHTIAKLNSYQKLLRSDAKGIATDLSLGVITEEQAEKELLVLKSIDETIQRRRELLNEYKNVAKEDVINENNLSSDATTLSSQIDAISQAEERMGNDAQEATDQARQGLAEMREEAEETSKTILRVFRGVKDEEAIGKPSENYDGGTFRSNNYHVASGYGNYVEESVVSMSNPYHIDAKGQEWNKIHILGEGLDENSKKAIDFIKKLQQIGSELYELAGLETKLQDGNPLDFANPKVPIATYYEVNEIIEELQSEIKKQSSEEIEETNKKIQTLSKLRDNYLETMNAYSDFSDDISHPYGMFKTSQLVQYAQNQGYDGLIIDNVFDNAGGKNVSSNVVVNFYEDQVKYIREIVEDGYKLIIKDLKDYNSLILNNLNADESGINQRINEWIQLSDKVEQAEKEFYSYAENHDEYESDESYDTFNKLKIAYEEARKTLLLFTKDNNRLLDETVSKANTIADIVKNISIDSFNETPDLFEGQSGQLSFIEELTDAEQKASDKATELANSLDKVAQETQIPGQMSFDDLNQAAHAEEKLLPMVIDTQQSLEKQNEELEHRNAIERAFLQTIGQDLESVQVREAIALLKEKREEQEKLNQAKKEEVAAPPSSTAENVDIKAEKSAEELHKEAKGMTEVKEESEKASTSKKGFAKANAEVLQSIRDSLTGLGDEAELFKTLNNIINKFSGKGSDERISTLANNIIKIKDALSGSIDDNSFIDALQKLSEQGENLKNLASVLKASKKQIESVKDSIDDSNELSLEDRDALAHQIAQSQEYEREQKRRLEQEKEIERARKEGQKQAEAYAKQQLDEQNKLTSSIENYSKKLQDAITADEIAKQTGAGVSKDLVNRWEALKADLSNIDVTADTSKAQEEFEKLKEKIDVALSPKERKFEKVIPEEIITNLGAQIEDFGAKNTRLSKELSERLEEVRRRYQALLNSGSTGDALERELKSISSELNKIKTEANAAGQAGKNFGHMMLDSLKSANARFIANYLSIQDMIRYVRELANTVREVDSAITELRKVSDASATRLQQNFEQSAKTAKELGSSITDVINQTADWARLGYNVDEAEKLARVTTLFQTVGDNMTAETASEAMISTLKAYSISVDESERIVDQYNEIANNFAIDTAGLADSITRAGAALHAGGNALSESMGLVVAANDSLQDPSSVGQMLKTMSMRLRGASVADLEELGIDTTGMSQGTKSIVQQFKAMAGIDIMEGTNYKSTFQILDELHDKWADLTDAEHAALTEAVGGKRGGSVMSSLMENWADAKAVVEKAEQSTGSAMKEQQNYAQSIQFSLDRLNASWQELQVDLLDSSAVKNIVDLGNQLVNIADKLISDKTALAGVLSLIAGGIATKKNVGGLKNTSPTPLFYYIV